jgi:3-oxoacyl-[acyl-carrier-protein] synthase-3
MAEAAYKVLDEAKVTLDDIDLLIPHQANVRIIDAVAKRLAIPEEKVVINLDRYGNTSSASIPIAYDEVARNGRLKKGDLVLMVTFGGGFTWGAALLRHN